MYGIGSVSPNQILQFDPIGRTSQVVLTTSLLTAGGGTSGSNAFSFDVDTFYMFWLYSGNATNNGPDANDNDPGMYYWNQQSGLDAVFLAPKSSFGYTVFPLNAAIYKFGTSVYYMWITENTKVLNWIPIIYNITGIPSGVGSVSSITFTGGAAASNFDFGDIAINPNTKILYGATQNGLFFSVDLGNFPSTTATYTCTTIANSGRGRPNIQISFDCTYSTLYGQAYLPTGPSGNNWYTVSLSNGALTSIAGFDTTGT